MMSEQLTRLRKFFERQPNKWIPLPKILNLRIAQYNRAISDLRNSGMKIRNETKMVKGVRHSWYRYNPD